MKTFDNWFMALLVILFGFACIGIAYGDMPGSGMEKQPRTLGHKAVMDIYFYAPKTLEITSETSLYFSDLDACKDAMRQALAIEIPTASEGDSVFIHCFAVETHIATKDEKQLPQGTQTL